MILKVIEERMRAQHETDFLQKILEGAKMCSDQDNATLKIDVEKLVVDYCKTMHFAGHETTSTSVTWSLMLLTANTDWQDRARAEVLQICQDGIPAIEHLRNMKVCRRRYGSKYRYWDAQITMIIQESLRLYTSVVFSPRTAFQGITFKYKYHYYTMTRKS